MMRHDGFMGSGVHAQGLEALARKAREAVRVIRAGDPLEAVEPALLLRLSELLPASTHGLAGHELEVERYSEGRPELVEATLVAEGFGLLHGLEQFAVQGFHDRDGWVRQGLRQGTASDDQRENATNLSEEKSHVGFL